MPTYFISKSTYIFNINIFAQIYGIDGSSEIPFQDLDSVETFKIILVNGSI